MRASVALPLILLSGIAGLLACTVTLDSLEGRRCDATHRCLAGYSCSTEGVCLLPRDAGGGFPDSGGFTVAPQGVCTNDGWCFAMPTPQGADIKDLLVRGDATALDVIAVGGSGLILRADGGYARDFLDTFESLNGIYLAADQSLWVVGDHGVILHDTGDGEWVHEDAGTAQNLFAVFGTGNNPLVVGGGGTVLRWDGKGFAHLDAGVLTPFYGGFALSATQAWLLGSDGTVDSTDGTRVAQGKVGTATYRSMTGTGVNDLWIAGSGGTVSHWNGVAWTTVDAGTTADLNRVVSVEGKLYLAGNGSTLLAQGPQGFAPVDAVVQGNVLALGGTAASNLWFAGQGGLLAATSDGVSFHNLSSPNPESYSSVWGSEGNDVWVAGSALGGFEHFDGMTWAPFAVPSMGDPGKGPTAVWGSGQGDLWAVTGDGQFLFFDGSAWQRFEVANSAPLHAIAGSAADDIWAVGDNGTLFHNDGTGWGAFALPVPAPTTSFLDVATLGGGEAWTVGSGGAAYHFDGEAWTAMDAGAGVQLNGLWGLSPDDVWAVGNNVIEHFDGQAWSPAGDAHGLTLKRVYGNDDTDLYAISAQGDILHGDGTTWTVQNGGTHGIPLNGIFGFGGGQVIVVGNGGVILQQSP